MKVKQIRWWFVTLVNQTVETNSSSASFFAGHQPKQTISKNMRQIFSISFGVDVKLTQQNGNYRFNLFLSSDRRGQVFICAREYWERERFRNQSAQSESKREKDEIKWKKKKIDVAHWTFIMLWTYGSNVPLFHSIAEL